jgi:hypothetical protein
VAVHLTIVSAFFITGCGNPFNEEPFSKQGWATATAVERAAMAEDLVTNHVSPGMSVEQIVSLVGEPEDTWVAGTVQRVLGEKTFAYYIGSWSLHDMDDAFVCVHFNESDQVIEAEIYGY